MPALSIHDRCDCRSRDQPVSTNQLGATLGHPRGAGHPALQQIDERLVRLPRPRRVGRPSSLHTDVRRPRLVIDSRRASKSDHGVVHPRTDRGRDGSLSSWYDRVFGHLHYLTAKCPVQSLLSCAWALGRAEVLPVAGPGVSNLLIAHGVRSASVRALLRNHRGRLDEVVEVRPSNRSPVPPRRVRGLCAPV